MADTPVAKRVDIYIIYICWNTKRKKHGAIRTAVPLVWSKNQVVLLFGGEVELREAQE